MSSAGRARLAIAIGASLLLAAIVGIVVATGGSDEAPAALQDGLDEGRWTGLAIADKVPVEEIAGLQATD